MELSEFLQARISEDEEVARAASPGPWYLNAEHDEVLAVDGITVCEGFALSGPQTRATTEHIARHNPARVLAECEAKRRIVEEHGSGADPCDHAYDTSLMGWMCTTLRLLALPYADHRDYDEGWRP